MDPDKKIIGLHRNVFFAGLVSFFMDLSSEMIYPLVPIFLSTVLGVNKSVIGLIEGIAESTASLLKVFSGWLSDKMGKRKALMIAGYGISALSRPIVALSTLWGHVLAFRFVDRFGKGIRGAPRDAVIAESTAMNELGRSFGFHRSMDTLGAVVGPAMAFLILSIFTGNFRLVFWLSMIPAIIAVAIIVFFIKDRSQRFHMSVKNDSVSNENLTLKTDTGANLNPTSFDWKYKIFITIATLFALGNSSDVFLILRAANIGIEETTIPILYLSFNLIYSLTSMPAGISADKFGKKRVILLGFIMFGLVYYGFAGASLKWHIWALFLLYGIFMGLTEGVQKAFIGTIIPQNMKATGYGLFNTFTGLAMLPASIIGGWLWDNISPSATFYFGAVTAGFATLLFIIFIGIVKTKG